MLNPKLKEGDRVRLLFMDGETIKPGTWGTVKSVSNVFGDDQYSMSWDDGDKDNIGDEVSRLSLISSEDAWDLGPKKRKLKESSDWSMANFYQDNKDMFKKFPSRSLSNIRKFLSAVRDSGLVNMIESSFLLTCGNERVLHFAKYKKVNNKKALRYVIDNADGIRNEIIRLSMIQLEGQNKEITPSSVSRMMGILSNKFTQMYMRFPVADNSKDYDNIDIEDEDDGYEDEDSEDEDDY